MMSLGLGLLFPAAVIALIVLGVMAVSNGRREPDPSGRRAYAIYLLSVTFVALFSALFALYALAAAGARLALGQTQLGECVRDATSISCRSQSGAFSSSSSSAVAPPAVPHAQQPDSRAQVEPVPAPPAPEPPPAFAPPPEPPPGFVLLGGPDAKKQRAREAVQAGLVAVAATAVLLFHAPRIPSLVKEPGFAESPARRTYLVYLYAVCLVAVLTALVSGAIAGSGLVSVIAPKLVGSGPIDLQRKEGAVELLSHGFLSAAAIGIFAHHWQRSKKIRLGPQQSKGDVAGREAGGP
ncbi:MAG: hypothetical protein M3N52_01310 [Actinomycetota bacterium]|nr:hypothetical protein [Actinomycetota bacterium]